MKLLRIKTNEYEENILGVTEFQETWSKNENWNVSFLVYKSNLNEFEYNLMVNEEIIIYEEQAFIIKNSEILSNGTVAVKQIEATHIMFNIQDHVQNAINEGERSYWIDEVLKFCLGSNDLGYTFEIKGDFEKVTIENLGDLDGLEAVNKVCDRFSAVVIPNNKHLVFYSESTWPTNTNEQFRDGFNTSNMSISIDTTNLKTAVRAFGMKKEESDDYFFEPFDYYSPEISKWNNGKAKWMKAIRDETINNKNTMIAKIKRELQDYPEISLSTSTLEIGPFGKGDVWTYINTEQQIKTDVTLVGYTRFTYDVSKSAEVVFSNARKSMVDIQGDIARAARNSERQLSNVSSLVSSNIPSSIKTASSNVNKVSNAVMFTENGIATNENELSKDSSIDVLFGHGSILIKGEKAISREGIDAKYLFNTEFIPNIPVYELATTTADGLMSSQMVIRLNDLEKLATPFSDGLMVSSDKRKLDYVKATKTADLDQMQQDIQELKGGK
ncbi:phage tail protein [Carnobacterium maltaromaticum]|uniref:phage tail protein n=1 Tax=Carnobacterium maltaromaticum TaxID=2751 RepID=UPI0012F87F47|nr:phage tail protein [Carnobacterium maltaromaticum]